MSSRCFLTVFFVLCIPLFSFSQQDKNTRNTLQYKRPTAVETGKIFQRNDTKWLYGGKRDQMHFNISNCELKDSGFRYGLGREYFSALIEPKFISFDLARLQFLPDDRFLLVEYGGEKKAYAVSDLINHEIVNDEIGGKAIMAAYCVLAELGAIYEREIGDYTFTFGSSGYTYADEDVWEGLNVFVLWDRETESLWWPPIGESVSGMMKGVKLPVMDEIYWSQTTWGEIVKEHSDALILKSHQDFVRPESWPKYESVKIKSSANPNPDIAPHWGENSD